MATLQPPPPPTKTGNAQVDAYLQSIYKWQYLFWYYQTNIGTEAGTLDGSIVLIPGLDGEPGEDGMTIIGPMGPQGIPGLSIPGMDGQDGEDAYPIPGQIKPEAYGTMYIYALGTGSVTVTVSAADTFYEISSGISGGTTKNMAFQNAKELRCMVPGNYVAILAASIECGSANQECESAIMVNGTANTSIAGHTQLATANKPSSVAASGVITLAVGDLVSASVLNHTAANNLIVDHLSVTLHYAGA